MSQTVTPSKSDINWQPEPASQIQVNDNPGFGEFV